MFQIQNQKPFSSIFENYTQELSKLFIESEQKKDPKYKTELCKTYSETKKCPYGFKCRFAHGKEELLSKIINSNYKKKDCKTFSENGFCPYGSRCSFRHDERKIEDIHLPFYYINTFIYCKPLNKRLSVFENITSDFKDNSIKFCSSSSSTVSNDDDVDFCKNKIKDFNLEEVKIFF